VNDKGFIENTSKHIASPDYEEYWEKQIVSARTLRDARTVIKEAFSGTGLPPQMQRTLMDNYPEEIKSILIHFSSA
jgi:hypothetical protein